MQFVLRLYEAEGREQPQSQPHQVGGKLYNSYALIIPLELINFLSNIEVTSHHLRGDENITSLKCPQPVKCY